MAVFDRIKGALYGVAVGDALGGPLEFMSREAVHRAYPDGLRDMVGGGWLNLKPGETTDEPIIEHWNKMSKQELAERILTELAALRNTESAESQAS